MAFFICQGCGVENPKTSNYQKWCSSCGIIQAKQRAKDYEEHQAHPCPGCGARVTRRYAECVRCSQPKRIAKITGDQNYAWKGGRSKDQWGYVQVLVAPEARKGHRYRAEHIVVWEAANGPLPEGYIVHHLNGVKDDNRLENLEAMSRKKHNHRHDQHDRRIVELEAEVARLRSLLDGYPLAKVQT